MVLAGTRKMLKLDNIILQLFEQSEELFVIRNNLLKMVELSNEEADQYHVSLLIKEIDLIRLTLLHEYELLDMSRIVQEEYTHLYYARRIEILQLSTQQIGRHFETLEGLCAAITHKEAGCTPDITFGTLENDA
jgi:hypothetical protein